MNKYEKGTHIMSEEASDEDNQPLSYEYISFNAALYIDVMQYRRGFAFLCEKIIRHNLRL